MFVNNNKYIKNSVVVNTIIAIIYVLFYDFIYNVYVCALFNETYIPLNSEQYIELILFGVVPVFFYKG